MKNHRILVVSFVCLMVIFGLFVFSFWGSSTKTNSPNKSGVIFKIEGGSPKEDYGKYWSFYQKPKSANNQDFKKVKIEKGKLSKGKVIYWKFEGFKPILEGRFEFNSIMLSIKNNRKNNGELNSKFWGYKNARRSLYVSWKKKKIRSSFAVFAKKDSGEEKFRHNVGGAKRLVWPIKASFTKSEKSKNKNIQIWNVDLKKTDVPIEIPYKHSGEICLPAFLERDFRISGIQKIRKKDAKLLSLIFIDLKKRKIIGEIDFSGSVFGEELRSNIDQENKVVACISSGLEWGIVVDFKEYFESLEIN